MNPREFAFHSRGSGANTAIDQAAEIAKQLGGRRSGTGWIALCPAHGDRTASLYLANRAGRVLVKCHAGCEQSAVVQALKDRGLWSARTTGSVAPVPVGDHLEAERIRIAQLMWRGALPAENSGAERYLRARGIAGAVPPSIRFLPKVRHTFSGKWFPALVAAVTVFPSREVTGVHRIFLSPTFSKALVSPAKMTLGSIKGGAVRFAPAGERLGLGEGIEDMLSVMDAEPSLPCWSVLGASGFSSVVLPSPPLATEVLLFADNDAIGLRAVRDAALRFTRDGRRVRIVLPPKGAKDFNEALQRAVSK